MLTLCVCVLGEGEVIDREEGKHTHFFLSYYKYI